MLVKGDPGFQLTGQDGWQYATINLTFQILTWHIFYTGCGDWLSFVWLWYAVFVSYEQVGCFDNCYKLLGISQGTCLHTFFKILYQSKTAKTVSNLGLLDKSDNLGSCISLSDSKNYTFGPWFNMKMSSYQYRKSHCGDKTILRPSYLHNGISYTGKMTSLYWISPQMCIGPW